ncbi:hypothetical protein [Rhizobium herbae]|uniref:Phage tail protein n=1 Tax=Rhizobium herbae TaxID=508661 RepID=A0ABS4EW39_9HYPH|nr:hypothetical protein [Rhizobium herbae]MBP1862128.1 hypothetical protein [Rhizobium herbae]
MQTFTIEYQGVTYANFSEGALIASGVPAAVLDAAKAANRREEIKTECRRRIYGTASAEAQMNISGAASLASAKVAADRSAEETALLETFALALKWISDMRASVETLSADPVSDFLTEDAWPDCPAAVLALCDQF